LWLDLKWTSSRTIAAERRNTNMNRIVSALLVVALASVGRADA